MKKMLVAVGVACSVLAACGGGGSDSGGTSTAKPVALSFYGSPLVSSAPAANAAVMMAQQTASDASAPSAASAPESASDAAAATVQALQAALAAKGVTATVLPQVMDSTTLHQIVIGENNGLPPTPDQFKTDPSEWMIVNFQLDDMVTPWTDPAQQAAVTQYANDLTVFVQRAAVSGKRVFAIQPIFTCDVPDRGGAAFGLDSALTQAKTRSTLAVIGSIPLDIAFDGAGHVIQSPDVEHLGADCRTPDAYLQNLRVQAVANDLANRLLPPPTQ
jgi:hypothetical protein